MAAINDDNTRLDALLETIPSESVSVSTNDRGVRSATIRVRDSHGNILDLNARNWRGLKPGWSFLAGEG